MTPVHGAESPERPALTIPGKPGTRAAPIPLARVHALLLNGGGTAAQNFSSHLSHVRQLSQMLIQAGLPTDKISVFSSDGDDPASDLAVAGPEPTPGQWLLDRTPEGEWLAPMPAFANSQLDGIKMNPASKKTLRAWFRQSRKRLKPDDVLLLFVTDHGTNPSEHSADRGASRITLWGNEDLSVRDLQQMLETLDPRVRVVSVMSQCFSGGFANLSETHARRGAPTGAACGFFSSTHDRPAYGCYAENAGAEKVGHAFEFLEALAQGGRVADAHLSTLERDRTPDVPLRTSDIYLMDVLGQAAYPSTAKPLKKTEPAVANAGPLPEDALGDKLLVRALRDRKRWEPELRLLDRLGETYGLFSPRSFAEIARVEDQVLAIMEQIAEHGKAWDKALGDLTNGNLRDFLKRNPEWTPRLRPKAVQGLPTGARSGLVHDLLEVLRPFSEKRGPFLDRVQRVFDRVDAFDALAYRMEVRLAALLRMRTVLTHVAGVTYLEKEGTREQRGGHAALLACEDLTLPLPAPKTPVRAPERLSDLTQDMESVRTLVPAGLGIVFHPVPEALAARYKLRDGASVVMRVVPDTPADAAGIQVGDIVVGEPHQPFTDPNQVRSWTMLSPTGKKLPLEILREKKPQTIHVILQPRPTRWPQLPARPKLGSIAPPVDGVRALRGKNVAELAAAGPYVLFFWATWCGPCKMAIPELLDYSKRRNVPVIAVTDEDAETVHGFLSRFENSFPDHVAADEFRTLFSNHGVSATPTFVLIGADGTIQDRTQGYHPSQGLKFRGWRWQEP